ncbi:MAG: hypothetical protein IAG13_13200 [Deltaproteobacteria bacterium]|nr:hypothetical protein [Nannocystaceae bacterium]
MAIRSACLAVLGLVVACERGPTTEPTAPMTEVVVTWSQIRAELDALVCVATFTDEGTTYQVPIHGDRGECKLPPPATALERATTEAFAEANTVIRAYPEVSQRTDEAARSTTDPAARLAAVRTALFDDRVITALLRRLDTALAAEGLRCSDCPTPPAITPRGVTWSELAPYLAAYVWPDPVVTLLGPDGKPSGAPEYTMHMCVGINGIQRMTKIDEDLRIAALLAAFETEVIFERAPQILAEVRGTPEYAALTTDEARTEHLRTHVGPRVTADPDVRAGICASLESFARDTPIRLTDCPKSA